MPKTETTWRSVEKDPPALGERVIATNGKFTGEAYRKELRGDIVWCRCMEHQMWAGKAPTLWQPMPVPPPSE